jgi:hypothetical protein
MDVSMSLQGWWWAGVVQSSREPSMRFKCAVDVEGESPNDLVHVRLFRNGQSWYGQGSDSAMGSGPCQPSEDEDIEDDVVLPAELTVSSRAAKIRQTLFELMDSDGNPRDDIPGEPDCSSCVQVHVRADGTVESVMFSHMFTLSEDVVGPASSARAMDGLRVVFAVVQVEECLQPCAFLIYMVRRLASAKERLEQVKAERSQLDHEADALDKAVDLVKDAADQDEAIKRSIYAAAFRDELNNYKRVLAEKYANP